MCNCNKGNTEIVPGSAYVAPVPLNCQYTEAQLDALLLVANPQEMPLVISQKNLYSVDCHRFFNLVQPLLIKYNL